MVLLPHGVYDIVPVDVGVWVFVGGQESVGNVES